MDNSFLHRKKLLLVDDEPDLLKMVSDILSDAGFETVLTAATVKEAIITAEKEKPDLMVLDVMLPDGDGFSLMKQLRTFTNVRKRRSSRQVGRSWPWSRRLYFKAVYAAGAITACLCGFAPNL